MTAMNFVWSATESKTNERLLFRLKTGGRGDKLIICAADFFRVFADGKFVCYGPERTARGFCRPRTVPLEGADVIEVEVAGYNVNCYACDLQQPFFGAEVYHGGKVVFGTEDFRCLTLPFVLSDVPRFSGQRGFMEVFDFTRKEPCEVAVMPVAPPVFLKGIGDTCNYEAADFTFLYESESAEFYEVRPAAHIGSAPAADFDVERDFLSKIAKGGYRARNFVHPYERTGFLKLEIEARSDTEIFAVMEEYLSDGKWIFRRSGCNDLLAVKVKAGVCSVQSFEPYALKHLKIIFSGDADIRPSLVALENNRKGCVFAEGDSRFTKVFEAAERTFRQNAVDILTDCPGRERAGWLCDSYFTAMSERLFTGSNEVERAFLENFIVSRTPEIPEGMIPKCFPAEHKNGLYIPNWGMWFIKELKDYYLRTGDRELIDAAKDKVYAFIKFFDAYNDEWGLLEDLDGWVFIEWSGCNSREFLRGVNFPSNMMFADALECAEELYGDLSLGARARAMKAKITELSYDGEFFADNAVRIDGRLCRCDDHISETCQYYALFSGLKPDDAFAQKMRTEFGPLRKEGFPEIVRSNVFIGFYLRFFWLCGEKDYERVLNEMLEYFGDMADKTGTLWEHDKPSASCNHGFASVAAVLMLRCVTGYETVKNARPQFKKDFTPPRKSAVKITFSYGGEKIIKTTGGKQQDFTELPAFIAK